MLSKPKWNRFYNHGSNRSVLSRAHVIYHFATFAPGRAAHLEPWNISSITSFSKNETEKSRMAWENPKFPPFLLLPPKTKSSKSSKPVPLSLAGNSKIPNGCTPLWHLWSQILPGYLCKALGGDLDEVNVHNNLKINPTKWQQLSIPKTSQK